MDRVATKSSKDSRSNVRPPVSGAGDVLLAPVPVPVTVVTPGSTGWPCRKVARRTPVGKQPVAPLCRVCEGRSGFRHRGAGRVILSGGSGRFPGLNTEWSTL
ncbi:hypothetical protein GCM10009817_19770 [Terrabacter lapilli]|uniref:Uncharacterized protein n=1 Tax=Terrabacter lapilli TaxID=436231 RepID=A0ABN2S327_9MICO